MEENKNNAVEKVENIANGTVDANSVQEQTTVQSSNENGKIQKERIRAERERALAEKRVELARIRAHKKAEREKAKAAVLRDRARRKAESEERRQRLAAERQARKEMLKNESKKERERRIQLERAAKRDERREARKERAEKRRAKYAERRERREQRNKNRERNRGFGGWLAAVISLGIATLVLASVLTFTYLMPTTNDNLLEAGYQKSFYDTVAQVDNIDLNLSKVLATKDGGAMQKYLVDTAINSELAENDLQQLPLQDESKYYTTKLINQIGDYAKYLNNKLIDGQSLSAADMEGLNQLYQANLTLKNALQTMVAGMGADYSFSSMIGGGNGDLLISNFNELQNLSVQYPELIYDGPFSDGQQEREIKGLSGEEISEETAKEIFLKAFGEYNISKVQSVGEANGDIACYNVQGQSKGENLYAQISKKGGKMIMFSYAGSCKETVIDQEEAIEKATEFMNGIGIKDMKAVWINLANNVYTINFAYEQDGVIVYSDLVKVRVCAETAMVIGIEARSYYTNHTERVIGSASLSKTVAKGKVSDNIKIDTARLALVPIGLKSEKLCYEFSGEYDGSTYYVYIDANTGRQVEMFKVIESTEGTLLM